MNSFETHWAREFTRYIDVVHKNDTCDSMIIWVYNNENDNKNLPWKYAFMGYHKQYFQMLQQILIEIFFK